MKAVVAACICGWCFGARAKLVTPEQQWRWRSVEFFVEVARAAWRADGNAACQILQPVGLLLGYTLCGTLRRAMTAQARKTSRSCCTCGRVRRIGWQPRW